METVKEVVNGNTFIELWGVWMLVCAMSWWTIASIIHLDRKAYPKELGPPTSVKLGEVFSIANALGWSIVTIYTVLMTIITKTG